MIMAQSKKSLFYCGFCLHNEVPMHNTGLKLLRVALNASRPFSHVLKVANVALYAICQSHDPVVRGSSQKSHFVWLF